MLGAALKCLLFACQLTHKPIMHSLGSSQESKQPVFHANHKLGRTRAARRTQAAAQCGC